jgi:DNA-binding MarR family transcriptional regulator
VNVPQPRNSTSARPGELSIVDGLAQLSFVIQGALERRASERGMSMIQTRLLGVLRDRTPTMNQLAKLLELDKSSVTGLVDRAEGRGLVERTPALTDGRVVLVSLTGEGRAQVADVASGFEADVAAIVATLPASDRKALRGLVSRVLVAHATGRGVDLFATRS